MQLQRERERERESKQQQKQKNNMHRYFDTLCSGLLIVVVCSCSSVLTFALVLNKSVWVVVVLRK